MPRTLYRTDPRADLTAPEVEALVLGGFELEAEEPGEDDPLVQTAAAFSALLKTSLTTSEAADLLAVDPSRIRHRLTSRPPSLYGIRVESSWRLPAFQFDRESLVPSVGDVVERLDPALHPIAVHRWFTTVNSDLLDEQLTGRALSPRDWLRLGFPPQTVIDLATDL